MAEREPRDDEFPFHLGAILDVSDYELDDQPNTRRTTMADGAVDQRELNTTTRAIRRFGVLVPDAAVQNFRTWVREHGWRWFDLHDLEDGIKRRARFIGGRVPLQRQRERLRGVGVVWRGSGEVEMQVGEG